jgi:uncharacterized membrane protein (UPF0127 family)
MGNCSRAAESGLRAGERRSWPSRFAVYSGVFARYPRTMPVRSRLGLVALLALVAACLAPLSAPAGARSPYAARLEVTELAVETLSGSRLFTVEVADAPAERARGLMFRRTLGSDEGMLFAYREARPVSMWMKNTYLSLDMLFIGADGRIVHIVERTTPLSTVPISSTAPVRAVLELPAGTVAASGIRRGDRVLHPIFAPVAEDAR